MFIVLLWRITSKRSGICIWSSFILPSTGSDILDKIVPSAATTLILNVSPITRKSRSPFLDPKTVSNFRTRLQRNMWAARKWSLCKRVSCNKNLFQNILRTWIFSSPFWPKEIVKFGGYVWKCFSLYISQSTNKNALQIHSSRGDDKC